MEGAATHPHTLPPARPGRAAAGPLAVILLGALGVGVLIGVTADPKLALILPACAAGAVAVTRWPVAGVTLLFVMTSTYGTLQAYEHTNARHPSDFVIIALWLAVLWSLATRREQRIWMWPSLMLLPLYIGLTAVEIFTAPDTSAGLRSFELSVLPMTATFLIALCPWPQERLMKAVRAILVVVALITLYNLYRYVVGPSHQEESLARNALPGVAHHVKLRFFGNFPTAQGLTTWFAIVIPFALALTLAWRGRWQLVAGFVVGVGAFIVIAASVLTATFAMIGGVALVVLLYALSPAFPGGQRLAASVLVLFAVVAVGGTAYALAVSGSSRESKFSAILDPTSDPTFQKRLDRWNQALADIDTHPFGRGLGTTGAAAIGQSTFEPVVTNQLDSSYIEIAFQQGLFVLVLFIMALVALLSGTVQRTIRSRDPARVAVAIGACGVLVAIAAEFFGGLYIERLHMVAAWLLIGLGVAMFTGRRVDDALAEQRAPAREPA